MAYITPKTDWQATDPITPADYNRIKNNLVYLNDIFNQQYSQYVFEPGADIGAEEFYKASKFNMFEDCVEHFQRTGRIITFGERSYYEDNGHMPNYNQLNRLERCIEAYAMIPVESITLSPSSVTISEGITETITVTVLPAEASDKSWNIIYDETKFTITKSESSFTISPISGVAQGDYEVIVQSVSDPSVTATLSVTIGVIPVTSVSLDENTLILAKSATATLVATVLPANATNKSVTWSTSDSSIATVSNGVVTAGTTVGNCTITVTTVDGGKTDTCTINVIAQSSGTYYNYDSVGSYPIDFVLVQKDRKIAGTSNPETAMMISKTIFKTSTSYNPSSNTLYKDSAMDTKLRSIYTTNFGAEFKDCLESYTVVSGRFDFQVANTMTTQVQTWTSEGLPVCVSNAFDLGVLNINDAETEMQNNVLVPVYTECTYLQNNPNLVNGYTDPTEASATESIYYISTMGFNQDSSKTISRIFNNNGIISISLQRNNNTSSSQSFRITVAINPNAKVYPTPQEDGAYVLDFNNLASSIAIKDLPLGTIIRDVPYNV